MNGVECKPVNKEDELKKGTMQFKINGTPYNVDLTSLAPDITLNTFLRDHAHLMATKFMCLEGGCGACVVSIKGKNPATGEIKTWSANSCLALLNTCGSWEITTSEGIGNQLDGYHPIQKRMAKLNASQCGYCTPGFVMNMYSLLESKGGQASMEEIENAFSGNICRCTGYRPILDAMKSFACDSNIRLPAECNDIEDLVGKKCPKSDSGALCSGQCHKPKPLRYADGSFWSWPQNLKELIHMLSQIPADEEYMLVGGNTAHGVYRRSEHIKHFIDIHELAELKEFKLTKDKLTLGAGLTLSETMDIFKKVANTNGFQYCQELWEHFQLIANVPVRNNGTLAGNISIKKAHREFSSDVFLLLETLNAKVIACRAPNGSPITLSMAEFLSDTTPKTIILAFELSAYPRANFIFKSYKIMPRAQNSVAYVNAGFLLELKTPAVGIVKTSRICFGGISTDFVHASAVEDMLKGQCFYHKAVVASLFSTLNSTLQPDAASSNASTEYRLKLASGLMFKFLLEVSPKDAVRLDYVSGGPLLKRGPSSGLQTFDTRPSVYPVTQPVEKLEALIQCAGEAKYMNDLITSKNTVHCAFVGATKVGHMIESIDASQALQMPGVVAFFSAKDIPGVNSIVDTAQMYAVEELFTSGLVRFYNQPLGMIVAQSRDIAERAITRVKVYYTHDDASSIMPTMADVLENKCLDRISTVLKSNVSEIKLSASADFEVNGIFEMGLQYHFAMEPQTCVVIPAEQSLEVYSSTQWHNHTQACIAKMLQLRAAQVQLKVRRLGGAFGSKLSRCNFVACAASLAAHKLNRPVRFVQSLESMMDTLGKRWACRSDYKVHGQANGKLVALQNIFYEDAGWSSNEYAPPVYPDSFRSCYAFSEENLKLEGKVVLTDAPSSTFMRAPGSLEGIAMIENIIEHIAFEGNLDPADVRLVNIKEGNKMKELLPQFLKSREYKKRRGKIDLFNAQNRWLKKGLGLAIMNFPLEYFPKFGTYPATVTIYHVDGSVVISHGGIEMGQGLNTKAAQVAAHILGIPLEFVKIESTDTVNGANALWSGASMSSECIGYAIRKCCNTLNDRLMPIRKSLEKNATWKQVVQVAWEKSTNLIASEQYKFGDIQEYSIHSLALTEVEVDILTGNHLIKRVDILQDVGESLSPNIDIGQIEGAFVMGLGYWLTEQVIYDRQTGQLLTNNTWTYKPPGAKDIPIDFRIEMLRGSGSKTGFMSSKSCAEPPMCLAVSVIFALQHAIQSARHDAALKRKWVSLGAPTTPETIVLNAGINVASFALK
ncbi:uncharacterized protein LOC106082773 [Stomoxys calcitrans]|uniref:uncharacterized protein LOC106082773 n=1 Tax=Stomoxys calcitrans TaxID=35570 RepID=UPI0027E2F5CC|nr:uncharacterized protein LOC106082773 [Stomoxys calcitrans]